MCSYLLAADIEHGNFAVISSAEGITVLTKTSMTTVHKGGQVFVDRCNQPVYVYIIRIIVIYKRSFIHFPLLSPTDIFSIIGLTLILNIFGQCDLKHISLEDIDTHCH